MTSGVVELAAKHDFPSAVLMPVLHWVQFSVFAGEVTRTAAEDLF